MKERRKRVGVLVKEVIAEIIQKEIQDPNLGILTITGVEMTKDLKRAKVFFSVLGDESTKKKAEAILSKATSFIRRRMSKKVRLRFIPELEFQFDTLLLAERRVDEILKSLHPKLPDDR
jgi:ribosome-binding factor A